MRILLQITTIAHKSLWLVTNSIEIIIKVTKYKPYILSSHISNMSARITIMLDDDLLKKLHDVQAKEIRQSSKSVSFSRVLNKELRKSLK